MNVKCFFRVHLQLTDPEASSHLSYDFQTIDYATTFAELAFNGCDISKVWIEIVENEVDTTNSPMWREV